MKRNTSIAIIAIFLSQNIAATQVFSSEPISPLPQTKVNINNPDISFIGRYGIIHQALSIYKLDAVQKRQKHAIKDLFEASLAGIQTPVFDIDNLDIGKKGWTRYYPFSVNGKRLTVRIFLTAERYYQPELTVLYEGSISSPAVTFQVLPDINDILKDCQIKPQNISVTAHTATRSSL